MRLLLVVALLVIAACKSPQDEAKASRETAASWAAAGAMLAEEWGRGAVSDAYARSTIRVAREELASLGASEQRRTWDALADAIARDDRAAAARLAARFRQR